MSVEYQGGLIKKRAAVDLTDKKYYGVKLDTNGDIQIAGENEAIGILIEECAKGNNATIKYLGETKMVASGEILAGSYLTTTAEGKATISSGKAMAIALTSAYNEDEYLSVAIIHGYAGA